MASPSQLIPYSSFSDALPILFLEARIHGNSHHFVTQMGVSIDADQCSVGMLTRTSGVLLIAGFGSYCAYRIANQYLGKGFVWTLFDAAHCDLLARADTRLLNPDPCCSKDSERRSIISIDEFDNEEDLEDGEKTPTSSASMKGLRRISASNGSSFIQLPQNSKIRRVLASVSPSKEGLAGISSMGEQRSRRNSDVSSIAGSSFSEASRIRRGERRRIPRLIANEDGDDDGGDFDDSASLAPTEASEIRLLWDGDACWDDEFAGPSGLQDDDRGIHSPTPSDISELSAFKTLKTMFESADAGSSTSMAEDDGMAAADAAADLAKLIHAKCMKSTNYMYHSVIVAGSDAGGSDIVSVCSGRSTKSNLSTLREKYAKRSHGLWELANNSRTKRDDDKYLLLEPSTSKSPNPMTDSGISKMSGSSSILQLSAPPQMIDSAIDTGFISSEDEASAASSSSKCKLKKSPNSSSSTASKPGIIRRTQLMDGIKEQSSSSSSPLHRITNSRASERSLEWFDEPL